MMSRAGLQFQGGPTFMETPFDSYAALRPPGSRWRSCARPWYRAWLVVLLASLLAQGTAIQAHLHLRADPAPIAAAAGGQGRSQAGGDDAAASFCQLCVAAASAGHYLLPPAQALPSPSPVALSVGQPSIPAFQLLRQALGWRSRAPPR